jgi:hypothetical protein
VDPYVQTDAFKTPVRVIRGIAPVVGVAGVSSVHWYQMTNDYEMTSSDDIHPIILKDSYVSYLALKPEYDNTPLTSTKSQPTQQNSSRIRIRIRICNQYLEISYRQCLQRCSCSISAVLSAFLVVSYELQWRSTYRQVSRNPLCVGYRGRAPVVGVVAVARVPFTIHH